MSNTARLIAYYLPQFHPVPENDLWWGKGFTEWTNVTKAKPLFPGHQQPNLPSELGFYDLRLPEVRQQQADLAREHGIEGFCYWHYWFGDGRRILERPFAEVLSSKQPNFPFCLAWANETWNGRQHGVKDNTVLIEQTYSGSHDFEEHFKTLLPAFRDERYITVDSKPLFVVYKPQHLPDALEFTGLWRQLAAKAGLPGLHLVALQDGSWNPLEHGFDAVVPHEPWQHFRSIPETIAAKFVRRALNRRLSDICRNRFRMPEQYQYREFVKNSFLVERRSNTYPCVIPNWDTTPRAHEWGVVLKNSRPELFAIHLSKAIRSVQNEAPEHRIVFIKSWNEWAEGNYLEPDRRYERGYLEAVKKCVSGEL
jgi:Glycosyltransferase WbsX